MPSSSDIQVFVRWKEQAIFAGEDVECVITFKNVASADLENGVSKRHHNGRGTRPMHGVVNGEKYMPPKSFMPFTTASSRRPSLLPPSQTASPRLPGTTNFQRGHRPSPSLSQHSNSFPITAPSPAAENGRGRGHRHQKSLSIISFESQQGAANSPRPTSKHSRSSSMQMTSSRNGWGGDNELLGSRSIRTPSVVSNPSPSVSNFDSPRLPIRPHSQRSTPPIRSKPPLSNDASHSTPLSPVDAAGDSPIEPPSFVFPPLSNGSPNKPRPRVPSVLDHNVPARQPPLSRVMSEATVTESPRNSTDIYSMSNISSETLQSEYTQYTHRTPHSHRRGPSSIDISGLRKTQKTQTLLMGYAQVSGSFSVDGSLVDQSQFENVKRSGVLGTTSSSQKRAQEKSRGGGFWENLGLNKIEESISGLFGNGELNGLREMRGVTSSQSIPLLSTPQSLLFVDLHLHPGEEKSFSFTLTLPKGLPASHRGKAIKISYNLIIGTQKSGTGKEVQRMSKISIPFRVLSGVDEEGEILGHDLKRPYVLLQDAAVVSEVENKAAFALHSNKKSIAGRTWTSAPELHAYVDELLKECTPDNYSPYRRISSPFEREPTPTGLPAHYTCKDAIDLAVLRSNQSASTERSPNRFEIARNGRRIAVIVLNRPSHRLGETVVATIDFQGAVLPCYSVRCYLESSERVDPMLALRSSTSIERATRRVYGSCAESTMFTQRVSFTPSIPVSATPTSLTSGITVDWQVRFAFVTSSVHDEFESGPTGLELLETAGEDERGKVMAPLEHLPCDYFEVAIPLKVYGSSIREQATEEVQGYPI